MGRCGGVPASVSLPASVSHPVPPPSTRYPVGWAGLGSPSHYSAMQEAEEVQCMAYPVGARWLERGCHSPRSAFDLAGTPQGQAGDCGSCSVVPSHLGCGRVVVLVPAGSDPALGAQGQRHRSLPDCSTQGDGCPRGILQGWDATLGPARHRLLLSLVAPSLPSPPWAQPKELTRPFERGPQRQLLEVIIFFRLFFLFPC